MILISKDWTLPSSYLNPLSSLAPCLRVFHSDVRQRCYGRTLSEASLDCGFVLGEHHYSSMRLGRTIEFMKNRGHWPPAWYAELWSKNNDNK